MFTGPGSSPPWLDRRAGAVDSAPVKRVSDTVEELDEYISVTWGRR